MRTGRHAAAQPPVMSEGTAERRKPAGGQYFSTVVKFTQLAAQAQHRLGMYLGNT
jgi:hypothetical protein